MAIKRFDVGVIESLAKTLGDTVQGFTGSEIGKLLQECKFPDPFANGTKWKRLYEAFCVKQEQDKCANNICVFIESAMSPARHINNLDWYLGTKYSLNQILSFEGLELGEDGKLKATNRVSTISEAYARASKLKESLLVRKVHPDILIFCSSVHDKKPNVLI